MRNGLKSPSPLVGEGRVRGRGETLFLLFLRVRVGIANPEPKGNECDRADNEENADVSHDVCSLSTISAVTRLRTANTAPPIKTHSGIGLGETNLPMTIPANANLLISRRYLARYSLCFVVNRTKVSIEAWHFTVKHPTPPIPFPLVGEG